jgi:hypothetical protein
MPFFRAQVVSWGWYTSVVDCSSYSGSLHTVSHLQGPSPVNSAEWWYKLNTYQPPQYLKFLLLEFYRLMCDCLILLWGIHRSHYLLQAKAFSRVIQICGLQPLFGLRHMHGKSAVLYSCQHALTLWNISSLSFVLLQKMQQESQLFNLLMIPWLSDCRNELVVFFLSMWYLMVWFSARASDLCFLQNVLTGSHPPVQWVQLFALWQSDKGVNLTTYLCLVLRFRVCVAMLLQPIYLHDIHSSGMLHAIDW